MNAQSKKLNQLVAAILMSMSLGTAWADNVITFEGESGVDNGMNNAANIDASGAKNATVSIYQINTTTGAGIGQSGYNVATAAGMNQVGDYATLNGDPLTIATADATTVTVTIGQGRDVTGDAGYGNNKSGSLNNIVSGKIGAIDATADANVQISQLGSLGSHTINLGNGDLGIGAGVKAGTLKATQSGAASLLDIKAMSGGSLTTTQSGTTNAINVTSMTGGTLTAEQKAGTDQTLNVISMSGGTLTTTQTGNAETLNVTAMTDGKTEINQSGNNSTLNFNSGDQGVAENYGTGVTGKVTVNQTGSYQQTNLDYVNGGFNGTLTLENNGTAAAGQNPATYATLDIKM